MDNGIQVPTDISIVAHDGSYPTQYTFPALTTVDVHPFQLGVEGIRMLLHKIENKESLSKQLLIYPQLIIRDSVRHI